MAGPDVQQRIQVERLPSLLRDIYEGKLLLPESPSSTWSDERRLRLFERIYHGLPLGAVTVLRTSRSLVHRRAIGSVPLLDRGEGVSRDYLVDGLGWVVALFEELGLAFWRGDKSSQRQPLVLTDTPRSFVAFDVPTRSFRLIEPKEITRQTEIALYVVFDAEAQHSTSAQLREGKHGEQWANRWSRVVEQFFDFSFPVTTVVSDRQEIIRSFFHTLENEPSPSKKASRTTRWYCDACGLPIRHFKDGWVEWLVRGVGTEYLGKGLRLVHHRPASPRPQGCQYNTRGEEFRRDGYALEDTALESFLGPDGLTHLLSLPSDYNFPREQLIELINRLHTPGYERARFHVGAAIAEGVIEPHLPPGFYLQDELARVLEWADAKGFKP